MTTTNALTIVYEREAYVRALNEYDRQADWYDRQMKVWNLCQGTSRHEFDAVLPVPPVKPVCPVYLSYPSCATGVPKPVVANSSVPMPRDELTKSFKDLFLTTSVPHRDTQYDFSSDDSDDDEVMWSVPEEVGTPPSVDGDFSSGESDSDEEMSCQDSPIKSAYQSEVLGPLANVWAESDEMLCGGGRNMRKKGRARTGGRRKGIRGFSSAPVAVNKSGTFAPDRQRTTLRYEQIFTLPVATGIAPWGLEQLKLSAPPNLTTVPTTIRGFAALLADYRKYRMAKFKLKFTVVNRDLLVPIEIFLAPVNSQPPTTTDPSKYIETLRPHSRKSLSFAPGMNVGSVSLSISLPKFAGAANSTIDDNYTGLMDGSSDPPNNVWCLYGYRTFGGGAITLGPSASISVELDGDFYELQSPAN